MFDLKQSTAFDFVFFAHDANGDAVTGKVDGNFTKRISKNGAAFAAMTVTITERENGWYHAQLSTSHADTLGLLSLTFTASGIKQVNNQYLVRAITADDLVRATTPANTLDVDASGDVTVGTSGDKGSPAGSNQMATVKLSTAIDIVFFAHDVNGAPVTGKVDGDWTIKRVSKAGGVFVGHSTVVTERERGFYAFNLTASATDTLGQLSMIYEASGVQAVNLQFMVEAVTNDDLTRSTTPGNALTVDGGGGVIVATNNDKTAYQLASGQSIDTVFSDLHVETGVTKIGTVDASPTPTTLQFASAALTETDTDHWVNSVIVFRDGPAVGQVRRISVFTPASDLVTISPALTSAPAAGNTFHILRQFEAAAGPADMTAVDGSAAAATNLKNALTGIVGTTMTLAQLDISGSDADGGVHIRNNAGPGMKIETTGTDEAGIVARGIGAGAGIDTQGGAGGEGLKGKGGAAMPGLYGEGGAGSGDGIKGLGIGSGDGIRGNGGATNGDGIAGVGSGTGAGMANAGGSGGGVGLNMTGGGGAEASAGGMDVNRIDGDTTVAATLVDALKTMLVVTGQNGPHTSTTFKTNATEATADHFIGRTLVWITGALAKQAADITDYAFDGTNGVFTFAAATEAPADTDKAIVV